MEYKTDKPSLDQDVLEEMRSLLEEEFDQVIESYRTDTLVRFEEIRESIENNSPGQLVAAAHQIKSTSLALGIVQLAHYAETMEQAGRAGSMVNQVDWLRLALREFDVVVSQLH